MVSRLLSFPRMLLAVSSAILVISGAFISVLPKKEATFRCAIDKPLEAFCRPTNEKTSFLASHLLSFVGLSLVSLIAIFYRSSVVSYYLEDCEREFRFT